MYWEQEPIVPRNGHTLVVGIVARISGCAKQKEMSLDDQIDHGKEVVADLYNGPVEYKIISTKGKGERLDRPELAELESLLRKRKLDLWIMEDLGRLIRGSEGVRFLGIAVDHGTRVISPNDCIDTNDPDWEQDAIEACKEHVGANIHTSKRLKQKLMNRFRKHGQAPARPIHGYIVPEGAESYFDWQRNDSATEKIRQGADQLRQSLNCTKTAEWLNENGVPTGPYCRKKKQWDGQLVRQFYQNMLLAGMPGRGFKVSIKNYETGRRVAVKNTKGRPVFIECPHLAHFTVEELESLNALLDAKNAKMGRKPVNGFDPRFRVSRKRTRCPGQHARCWYCGRECLWGANGIVGNLMCSGARERKCWNSIGFNGELAAQRMVDAVVAEFGYLDGLDGQFRGIVQTADAELFTGKVCWRDLQAEEEHMARERENVQASLRELGPLPLVREMIDELAARERSLQQRKHELERLQARELNLPQSAAELRQLLQQHFKDLAVRSFEFADFMRLLVPQFHVYLVRLCDGGHLLPRAKVRLNLAGCIEDAVHAPALRELLSRELTIDLFKKPPQREEIRERVIQMIDDDFDQREIASKLGGRIQQANVSKAKLLNDCMIAQGLSTPYVFVAEPPDDYPKLRRHKHAKYRFGPLEGYNRPTL